MERKNRYQNSVCRPGWLHLFLPIKETWAGTLERCERCGRKIHFPRTMPNHMYLSYHIRSVLRADDRLFAREYPNIQV